MSFPEPLGRHVVKERSGGKCEAAIPNVCMGGAQTVHHRLKRSHGGGWNPSNLLHLCGDGTIGCHGWIEAHPQLANEDGLWLFAGEDPAETAAHMRWENLRSWYLLDDHGVLHWQTSDFEPIVGSWSGTLAFHVKPSR